ncbi:MAG TPA: energy-coupling factor transporter transmembrane component T [Spirochaetota bacterium]|nr:energy-coupling factor transporter transmembrane component T [Spirochaetota bacterium]
MKLTSSYGMTHAMTIVESSPLRRADPRTKLALCLCASLAVMLPLEKIIFFASVYVLFLIWARLLPEAARQAWKLKWILGVLFLVDWLVISLDLAVVVTLRLLLMAGVFAMFFSTTTPSELCLALVWLRVPYRYAFSISLSFQTVSSIDTEWRGILEAQRARGAFEAPKGWRYIVEQVRNLVSLTVPAVVLTARRAWSMTEAAYARGFESPHRTAFNRLSMRAIDWAILAGAGMVAAAIIIWR